MTYSDQDNESTLTDEYRWNLLQSRSHTLKLQQAFTLYREEELEPVLIKGWAALRFYPESKFRPSSDIDLAFSPDQYPEAVRVAGADRFRALNLDLHSGLRHLDTAQWDDLFDNSRIIDLEGVPIRVLRPEDHLRVLSVHWLTDGGAYKERLWDIYYAVDNRPSDFDWERCLNTVSEIRRRWIVCVIGLAHRYLDLDISDLPFAAEAAEVPEWMIRTVEREWASEVRLTPIHVFLRNPKELVKQIRKRFPPNPIQSTIDMEGSPDASTRIHYQIGSVIKRTVPSLKRVIPTFFRFRN